MIVIFKATYFQLPGYVNSIKKYFTRDLVVKLAVYSKHLAEGLIDETFSTVVNVSPMQIYNPCLK